MGNINEYREPKPESVKAQFQLWEYIMKLTIKTHAALRAYNLLPREELAKNLRENANDGIMKQIEITRNNIFDALEIFTNFNEFFAENSAKLSNEDDEEITSSEDEEEDDITDGFTKNNSVKEIKRIACSEEKLNKLENLLSSNEKKFSKTLSQVLSKWDDRTRFVAGTKSKGMSTLESSVMKQIDKVLSDKFRLLRKTQYRRNNHVRLGGNLEIQFDSEIFDDDDFYQTLLKEFIESKNTDTYDPIEMSRRHIELEKLKTMKIKKCVDPSANYDGKIKFITIPKLVNFCPSRPETVQWAHEKRNDLFKSLFS